MNDATLPRNSIMLSGFKSLTFVLLKVYHYLNFSENMKSLIAFLLFTLVSGASDGQCIWEKNGKLPFTGIISRSTNWETITRTPLSSISFQMVEFFQDSSMHLNVKINRNHHQISERYFDGKSKIMIKSGDTFITINFLGSTDHGDILTSYGNFLLADKEFLRHNLIDMVRIYFDEGYDDYRKQDSVSSIPLSRYSISKDFQTDYFIRTLKCFE